MFRNDYSAEEEYELSLQLQEMMGSGTIKFL